MKKPVIRALDFIRVLSTYGIVLSHFSFYQPQGGFRPLHTYANGSWGSTLVTVFFVLSGFSLAYHYSGRLSGGALKSYFIKRWKSIFPMYYIAYACIEIPRILVHRSISYRGHPAQYLFTLIGMDGYLAQTFPTAYNLGEWFTGAIILLYLLFPLLMRFYEKSKLLTAAGVLLVYVLTLHQPLITPEPYWTIPSCLISFACGVYLLSVRSLLRDIRVAVPCGLGVLVLCFVKLPISGNVGAHVTGVLLFVLLYFIGEQLTALPRPAALCAWLSRIAYGVFLTHHVAIIYTLAIWHPQQPAALFVLLLALLAMITAAAFVLTHLTAKVTRMVGSIFSRCAA